MYVELFRIGNYYQKKGIGINLHNKNLILYANRFSEKQEGIHQHNHFLLFSRKWVLIVRSQSETNATSSSKTM